MQYLLMLYSNEAGWPAMTPAQQEQGMAAYQAYTQALRTAGVLRGSDRLEPSSTATTVRVATSPPSAASEKITGLVDPGPLASS
jgi:hypothetical protein